MHGPDEDEDVAKVASRRVRMDVSILVVLLLLMLVLMGVRLIRSAPTILNRIFMALFND